MTLLDPKAPFLFGVLMIGLLGAYLVVFHAMPGSLAAPHAEVIRGAGLSTCRQCHTQKGFNAACLACHDQIAAQLTTDEGYHAFLAREGHEECTECHLEHLGPDAPLTGALSWMHVDLDCFRHPHVVFGLSGAHDELACEACHQKGSPAAGASAYLGLTQECVGCHEDIHAGGLAQDCSCCHDQRAWRPAPQFHHDDYYPLAGAHARVGCPDCHLIPDRDDPNVAAGAVAADITLAFNQVRGTTCVECHVSPHRTAWPQDCSGCHLGTDDAWGEGQRGIGVEAHALAGFALVGAHADVACQACHPPDLPYALRYPDPHGAGYARRPDTCEGCHDDPHADQFRQRYSGCLACHEKDRFSPARFDRVRHAEVYPLRFAHETVDCSACHPVDEATGARRYVATPRECEACHEDPHAGQFAERYAGCTDCHDEDHFRPAQFSVARHAETYPLRGGHKGVPCVQCHTSEGAATVRQFVATPRQCKACHENPHGSQFETELREDDCVVCHSDEGETFRIQPYDHERQAGYPLTGAHAQAACVDCHREQPFGDPNGPETMVRVFRGTSAACAACHEDAHRGQFEDRDLDGHVDCERCHGSTTQWSADRFDHEHDGRFALEGSHQDVACQSCHPSVRQPDGQYVTQYRPLGTRCEDCHGFASK